MFSRSGYQPSLWAGVRLFTLPLEVGRVFTKGLVCAHCPISTWYLSGHLLQHPIHLNMQIFTGEKSTSCIAIYMWVELFIITINNYICQKLCNTQDLSICQSVTKVISRSVVKWVTHLPGTLLIWSFNVRNRLQPSLNWPLSNLRNPHFDIEM